jgi:hypothetical protein
MAFIPTVASAQKNINSARTIYQDALAQVAEGRAQLQAEVDAGRLVPGTQEFLNARNQLVNSRQSYADTAKLQYDEDLAALDTARQFEQTGESQVSTQASTTLAPNQSPGEPQPTPIVGAGDIDPIPAPVDPNTDPVAEFRRGSGEELAVPTQDVPVSDTSGYSEQNELAVPTADIRYSPEELDALAAANGVSQGEPDIEVGITDAQLFEAESVFGGAPSQSGVSSQVRQAQNQQTNSSLAQFPVNTDWRVTLRLAPGATYLYNAPQAGLLQPLKTTNGVVFPYTPSITTAYKANYSDYNLTHSNYRGYFYQNSYTDAIQLNATFTAQSTADAAYVLAVIHFFRSVTKMFYGQDAQRGSPPPLVFLSGLGDYQFNNHPCLVSQFNYVLPADVDYISSGSPNNLGLNLQPLQNLYSTTLNAVAPTVTRLASAFLPKGAENEVSAPLQALLNNPTYVPSKIDIQLSLLPVQSRSQVSKQFSLKNFANGNLLKGGFW